MSSCLSGGGRTYCFGLDIVKSPSPSSPSSHSSSPSSTLSNSSNSPIAISTKKSRTPRKRPNQSFAEAAALLSTVYPNIFSTKNLRKLCKHIKPYEYFSQSSELLPPFPASSDAGFLLRGSSPEKPAFGIDPKPSNSLKNADWSPPSNGFWEFSSPDLLEDDFDAESILDEEIEEGVDSIMGNLSMNTTTSINEDTWNCGGHMNPSSFGNLMHFNISRKFDFGFGGGMRRALRSVDGGDRWSSPIVVVEDIVPKFKASSMPLSEKQKKKKEKRKKKKKVVEEEEPWDLQTITTSSPGSLRSGLCLNLNYEEVLKAWSNRGSPFSDGPDSPEFSPDALICI